MATSWTPDRAWRWVQDNRARASLGADGKAKIANLPKGLPVPNGLIDALTSYLLTHPNGVAPKPTRDDQRRMRARETEQRRKQADRADDGDDQPAAQPAAPASLLDALDGHEWTVADLLAHRFPDRRQFIPGIIEE